jgi:hypothetical protein
MTMKEKEFHAVGLATLKLPLKTERPGLDPASNRWRETFSLSGSLSSPQQPLAIAPHFYPKFRIRQYNTTR